VSNKIKIPTKTKGKGYVGTWKTDELGWWMPQHVHPASTGEPNEVAVEKGYFKGERVFLCEIIIKPLKDKKGRPITKIIKP
jgi:hypothetical protein